MIITRNPSAYAVSDGMTPCGFRTCAVPGRPVAVHILREDLPVAPAGTHLCAYHSPYDVVEVADPAPLVICTRALVLGGTQPEADDDLIGFRMQRSGRSFRKGFPRMRRELLPLV